MTQEERILEWLKSGYSITPLEALNKFGCFRLSAIIFNLRQSGYDIETEIVGKGKHYAEYKLVTKTESNGQRMFV